MAWNKIKVGPLGGDQITRVDYIFNRCSNNSNRCNGADSEDWTHGRYPGLPWGGLTYLDECNQQIWSANGSWMIGNKTDQFDVNKEAWEKMMKRQEFSLKCPIYDGRLYFVRGTIKGCNQFTTTCMVKWSFDANSFLLVKKLCVHIPFHVTFQWLPVKKAAYSCPPLFLWSCLCDSTWPAK